MTKHSQAQISEYYLYDIDDLVRIWKSGWQNLAKLVSTLHISDQIGFDRPSWLFLSELDHLLRKINPKVPYVEGLVICNLLGLAATPDTEPYSPQNDVDESLRGRDMTADDTDLKELVKKVTSALATSQTLGEVVSKVATKRNLDGFLNRVYTDGIMHYAEMLSLAMTTPWSREIKVLCDALNQYSSWEEAWWNYVWWHLKHLADKLMEIERCIKADIPLTHPQEVCIRICMRVGYPVGHWIRDKYGRQTYQIVLMIEDVRHDPDLDMQSPTETIVSGLRMQLAFTLAQQLQDKCSEPRFIQSCRAPSCSNSFYTTRAAQKACARSQRGRRSRCKAEWDSYRKWLKSIGSDPEKVWNKPELKKQFLGVYHPRGSQTFH